MNNLVNKEPVKLDLLKVDGNAFSILGAFRRQASREGWTPEEIKTVIDEAMSGDYDHLVGVIVNHCK